MTRLGSATAGRRRGWALLLVGMAAALAGCGGAGGSQSGTVVIGSPNFTEGIVLGNIYAQALQAKGVKVSTKLNLGDREVVFPSLKSGNLDITPEYTGALVDYLSKGSSTATAPADVYAALGKALPSGLEALQMSGAEDKDVFVVTGPTATKYNLHSLADLAPVGSKLVFGGPPEDKTRQVGLVGLKSVYGVTFQDFRPLDADGPLTIGALQSQSIQVGNLFSTDSVIKQNGWVILADPKNLIPAQNVLPVVRSAAMTPTIRSALDQVSTRLTTDALTTMDSHVDNDKQDPEKVARDWLREQGLAS